MSEIGEFLKKLRGKMSLREAAERSGLSHSYIRSLENGKHPNTGAPITPSPESLRALSKAYRYPYEELMVKAGHIKEEPTNKGQTIPSKTIDKIVEHLSEMPEEDQIYYLELLKRISKQ